MGKQKHSEGFNLPKPEIDAIEQFLSTITNRWDALEAQPQLEIRALKEGNTTDVQRFNYRDIKSSAAYAHCLNEAGWNLYACINPVSSRTVGAAKDADILASFLCFADADTPEGSAAIAVADPQPSFVIVTGSTPWIRCHAYWELDSPCIDLNLWRHAQESIASNLGTDPTIVNPSRIMRMAGTVSYPSTKKIEKGYQPEIVRFQKVELPSVQH
ncbi:hypothetical protein ACFQ3C_03895 [Seohaeicola saemankumensis]|uniref:Nitroreductase domain-containing protein n=1 Tax=Seohaeicola saemankumensis TaxID=481181 RepID=A0ABW3TA53_9RHOB